LDPITIIMLAVLALLIFFMFRNSRKRQKDQSELQSKVQPGAKVMTNFGVYGTILSIDEEENEVLLESTPGTVLAVHRQTVARVVTPVADDLSAPAEPLETPEGEPEFGERLDEPTIADADNDGKKSND
jgi:preprotein translocase subunit YajC